MTRATLLHVLDHATAISPEEVRELEQLAQAFPYCQTAHLLLAKAAHDQGTMLAGQRLRRAATYAADRELLRRLIEQLPEAPGEEVTIMEVAPAPETVVESVPEPTAMPPAPEPPAPTETAPEEPTATPASVEPAPASGASAEAIEVPVAPAAAVHPAVEESSETPAPEAVAQESALIVEVPVAALPPAAATAEPETQPIDEESPAQIPEPPVAEATTGSEPVADELPATAPPIRPPAEQGAARFEFGLSQRLPAVPLYQLPGLDDGPDVAQAGLSRVADAKAAPSAGTEPIFTPAAFTGDAGVGYGLSQGSRLGLALEPLLTEILRASSWEVPAEPLPPPGTFFEPDVLLAGHWATHRPTPLPLPTSLDLVNNFLRRQPRLTRPAAPTPMTEAQVQADLSVRSTRPEPELASESLARILARQGKNERAIEVYQRLMVKQPEKAAYFSVQIQQLLPPV